MAAMTPPHLPLEPLAWDGEQPRSQRFDDPYFSRAGGLAEARAVFLDGCALPAAWADRSDFVVGELGFGTGLNVAALLELWRRTRPVAGRLHIFSIDAHPLAASDAARALAAFPEIAEPAAALVAHWPRRARGFHRVDLPGFAAVLDLAFLDVEPALAGWSGAADAWFLDGFAPTRNPDMWSEPVLAAVARRSAPGARLATYSVSGLVRRGLAAAGFAADKRPGFGGKRERLEARLQTQPPARWPRRAKAAIVGAGVAGAALARALAALGARPLVMEAASPGAGASGNPAALVMPRPDAGGGPVGALYAQALARAADVYAATPDAVIARGAIQLEVGPKDPARHARIAASDLFEAGAIEHLHPAAVSAAIGELAAGRGLFFRDALVVDPSAVLAGWLAHADRGGAHVASILPSSYGWRLLDAGGGEIACADVVFVSAGVGAARLLADAPLSALRGQVTMATHTATSAWIGAGYAIPTRAGVLIGATHDRGDAGEDVREGDHARNLERLAQDAPATASQLRGQRLLGRASVRAVTPDFLPLAGDSGGGLFVLSGLGSRGFCSAPLLAEHVAAIALGAPSPLPAPLAAIVDPRRFEMRRERRLARSGKVQTDALR